MEAVEADRAEPVVPVRVVEAMDVEQSVLLSIVAVVHVVVEV